MANYKKRTLPELEDLAFQVGDFIEYWGFKKVHGRIWTHIFLSDRPLDAADLMERLGISKALVSMSIADLLEYDVIQSSGKSKRGTIVYKANPNIVSTITNVLRKRERRMLSRLSAAIRLVRELSREAKSDAELSSSRISTLAEMIKGAELCLDKMIQLTEVSFSLWTKFQKVSESETKEL